MGSTILNIDTKHFQSKTSLFGPRNNPNRAHFGDGFQPYRSVVRSFPLLSPPCLPSWTSKNVAFVCIIATGGFLGRLYWYIRHNFDAIFTYPTPCWWYFGVSDIILAPFFTFRQHLFMNFLKMNHSSDPIHLIQFADSICPSLRCAALGWYEDYTDGAP